MLSASRMVEDLPGFWTANYIEIQEYLKKYPDIQCEHYATELDNGNFDQLVCVSVNNKRARDVIINFYFSGDHAGMTGLQEAVFTIGTPHPADFQEIMESYWLHDAIPLHRETDWFHDTMTSLIFYTEDTVLRFDLPNFDSGGSKFTTVDFWDINGGRMGVG